ncbi:hypothetical protein JTE90_012649 [Oedothorax gibbosus]|uniref:SEA domain-containing protein n=1 Tax=Oedothorax gibbosus TaxID=931172 RepID=A0AAV6U022_9ARAC|nr:hypothetical protein JTE90_012649 [Oedothorax gibbosus]
MLRLFLLVVGEGLIMLSSGETTVSFIQDNTDHPQFSTELEHISLPTIAEPSTEDNLQRENTTVDFHNSGSPADSIQRVNHTSKESETKEVEQPTESVNEGKDPTSVVEILEIHSTAVTFKLDSQNATGTQPEVDIVDVSSMFSDENTSHGSVNFVDSSSTSNDSVYIGKESAETETTYSPSTATRKLSIASSASESVEETTIPDVARPQTTQDFNSESSSVVEESSSSSEESYESTEKLDNGSLISHQPYNLEREEMTTSGSKVADFERESEFIEMAGSEDFVKVVPSEKVVQVQSVIIRPAVAVISEEHDIVNNAEVVIPKKGENNVGHSNEHNLGVAFDPDGMTHDGPQDPDSVIFSVPEDSREIESSREDFEIAPNEGENINSMKKLTPNGGRKFEKLENIQTESSYPEREGMEVPLKSSSYPVSFEMGVTLPEFQIHNNSRDNESEEMLQDAPHGINILPDFSTIIPEEAVMITEKQDFGPKSIAPVTITNEPTIDTMKNVGNKSSDFIQNTSTTEELKTDILGEKTSATIKMTITTKLPKTEDLKISIEDNVSTVSQIPDQSVIRPVKVSSPSPVSNPLSTQPSTAMSSLSDPTSDIVDIVAESSSARSSSPILPEPVHKVAGNIEVSTFIPSPELVASTMNSNVTTIEVKSSVSMAMPVSDSTIQSSPTTASTNSNITLNSVILPVDKKETNETSFTQTSLTQSTTEAPSTGVKIRKPKLKIGGSTDEARPSRAPYVPKRPGYGPTTEAGPPVSIFKKQRTRIASITSSTTARPFRPYSTIRVHYATHGGFPIMPELIISTEPVTTTTEPTTTTTEEPIEEVPFTAQTVSPIVSDKEETTLVKVAAYIALDRGIRWHPLLDNRQTPEYKENAERVLMHLERLFRSSPIATRLWKIEIDGFSGNHSSRPVGVDFFLYLIKSTPVSPEHLTSIFKGQLTDSRTFGTFRVDVGQTAFDVLQEEPLIKATPPPGDEDEGVEPPIPQWAIACIVIGAASLIFIVLFAAVTLYGRHHMRRRYSSSKLNSEGEDGVKGDWESKMAAAYENMAADTLYDADDNTYKKHSGGRLATFHGLPSPLQRSESWNSTRVAPRWTQHFD